MDEEVAPVKFFKYVPNGFVHIWEQAGWESTDAFKDTHHGYYSTLMEWKGEGEPICPRNEDAA